MNGLWYVELLGGLHALRSTSNSSDSETRVGSAPRFSNPVATVTRFRSQRTDALFAYLALYRDRPHTREELITLLWPDADPEAARVNLRSALASIRRELEKPDLPAGSVLIARGHTQVSLDRNAVQTDVARFEELLRDARHTGVSVSARRRLLSEAVALYRGPLLPDLYESWVLSERERLAGEYVFALRELSRCYLEIGEMAEAQDIVRRAVAADPLNENVRADLIRLLAASGDRSRALRQYQEIVVLLREQLGVSPSAELAALRDAVEAGYAREGVAQTAVPVALAESPAPQRAAPETQDVPLPDVSPPPQHLPATFTTFFGREGELEAIAALLTRENARLVTLTGPGGAGKTRLAVESARHVASRFPGGVWFIPLADLRDPTHIPNILAEAISTPESPRTALERVIQSLKEWPASLLVLDNFEQLVEGGTSPIRELLARVPQLTCLITSRHHLMIEAEHPFAVLPLPTPLFYGTPERLMEFSSIQLFVDRARAVAPHFQLDSGNASIVADICACLEGIPLALELAAAWSRVLTPAQIQERLKRRFDLLVTRQRDAEARHATLENAIQWSWELLPVKLRQLFAGLSVFRGGWTLESAEAVCGGSSSEWTLLEELDELTARSMIIAAQDNVNRTMRFRMLETLREFADAQLTAEERTTLRQRHLRWTLSLVEETVPASASSEGDWWLHRLEVEQDNLRAAFDFCQTGVTEEDTEVGLRLATVLSPFWYQRGAWEESRQRLSGLLGVGKDLETDDETLKHARPTRSRAYALYNLARLTDSDTTPKRMGLYYDHASRYFLQLNDVRGRAIALMGKARGLTRQGTIVAAHEAAAEGLQLARTTDDRHCLSSGLTELGWILCEMGDFTAGRALLEESLARERTDPGGDAPLAYSDEGCWAFACLGIWSLQAAEFADAERFLTEYLTLRRQQGIPWAVAHAASLLSETLLQTGDLDRTHIYMTEALTIREVLGSPGPIAESLHAVARWHEARGDLREAENLLNHALALYRTADQVPGITETLDTLARIIIRRDPAMADRLAWESLQLRQTRRYPKDVLLSLATFATLAAGRGEPELAAQLWGATEALREALSLPLTPLERRQIETGGAMEGWGLLGDAAFQTAWNEGRALTPDAALRLLSPH